MKLAVLWKIISFTASRLISQCTKKHGVHTNTVENAKNLQRNRLESRPVHAVCMVEENFWCTTQKTDDNTIIQCSLILYYLEATYRFEMFNWLFVIPKIRIPNSSEVVLSSKPLHKSTDKSYQPALLEPTEKKNELWLASEEKARFSYELSPLTVLNKCDNLKSSSAGILYSHDV